MFSKNTNDFPAKPSYVLLLSEEMKFQVRVSLSVSQFSDKLLLVAPADRWGCNKEDFSAKQVGLLLNK